MTSRFLSLAALAALNTTAAPCMAAVRTRFVDDADPNLAGFSKTDVSKASISNGKMTYELASDGLLSSPVVRSDSMP